MNQYQRRILAMQIYQSKVGAVNNQLLPLIKEAIGMRDHDRLILLEAQREFKLAQLLQAWQKVDNSIQRFHS